MNSVALTKQHLMIALLGTGIIISSILVAPDAYARHLSDNQRYSDGFNDGIQASITDRQNGNPFNPACDPTGEHTSDGQHTTIYCTGWSNGYTSSWNEQSSTQNQQQEQKQSQTVHSCIAIKCEIIQGQDQQSNQGVTGGGQ